MKVLVACFLLCSLLCNAFAKKRDIDQLELQENLQRFYTRFTERTLESLLSNPRLQTNSEMGLAAMKEYLLYDSEALKISTGPYPEVNLLDMLTFIKLNKLVIKHWWIPKVWGKDGAPLLKSFRESEKDIDQIALKIMSKDEIRQVNKLIIQWRRKNPKQFRVEKIRLGDFAEVASLSGQQRQEEGGFSLSNLLVNTKSAVKAVDQMVLVANRAIFLAQYLPTLVRLQTRIGTQEIIDDVMLRISRTKTNLKGVKEVKPIMASMSSLTKDLNSLTDEVSGLLKTYKSEFPDGINATENLKEIHRIVDTSNSLVKELKAVRADENVLSRIKKDFRDTLIFIGLLFIAVGAIISLFWWTGAYIVKRSLIKHETKG